jgi:hypothetical protein
MMPNDVSAAKTNVKRGASIAWAWILASVLTRADDGVLPAVAWPAVEDHTTVSWLPGFPHRAAGAAWQRCMQTGRYAFVLDTQTMTIPHLGSIEAAAYDVAVRSNAKAISALPSADLDLLLHVDGEIYRCTGSRAWDGLVGPRLIESGRWVQRSDVDGLVFASDGGKPLNVEARFETVGWPDRLAMILAARPGFEPIAAGRASFGRLGGGFGLDGTNDFVVPPAARVDATCFTLECWIYAPPDFDGATKAMPWLVCGGHHELAAGNYGITIHGGVPRAWLNIGGGRDGAFSAAAHARLVTEAWNQVVLSYDGTDLKVFLNGTRGEVKRVGRERIAGTCGLVFGRRGDNAGDGYRFRGVVDEIAFYDRALSDEEVRARFLVPEKPPASGPAVFVESFDPEGRPLATRSQVGWKHASMAIRLQTVGATIEERKDLPDHPAGAGWHEVALVMDPASQPLTAERRLPAPAVVVEAMPIAGDAQTRAAALPASNDAIRGWRCIDLDGVELILPPDGYQRQSPVSVGAVMRDARNDAVERVRLVLKNPADVEQVARLCFAKSRFSGGRVGSPITGLSAILRDARGQPTGIPVQLSKNWHRGRGGSPYDGEWFHGFTQVRLPARATVHLELVMAYGHWGGVPAASHAQLSLLGWGSNQLWEVATVGSWGESICYEPDQVQTGASILDMRPLQVRSLPDGKPWQWTGNVGGADFLVLEGSDRARVPRRNMKSAFIRSGPCLTEVMHAGELGTGIDHAETVSISRSDDILRGTYRLRMDVREPVDFSRFVIFQIGADRYSQLRAKRLALGDASGLIREWEAQWGGDAYKTPAMECPDDNPWVSLHAVEMTDEAMPTACGGFVIREWRAVLGGSDARPWVAEHGTPSSSRPSSTIDIVPPPGVNRLQPGDFVEAVIQHVALPLSAEAYYGPDESLRSALQERANTWRMVHREAVGNARTVEVTRGRLRWCYPDVRVEVDDGSAELTLHGGLGHVPITFLGLGSHVGGELQIDGKPVDQSVHGADFWQTDYEATKKTWSQTLTVAPRESLSTPMKQDTRIVWRHPKSGSQP